jgi:hypothetical protein
VPSCGCGGERSCARLGGSRLALRGVALSPHYPAALRLIALRKTAPTRARAFRAYQTPLRAAARASARLRREHRDGTCALWLRIA